MCEELEMKRDEHLGFDASCRGCDKWRKGPRPQWQTDNGEDLYLPNAMLEHLLAD